MATYGIRARLATLAIALSLITAGLPANASDVDPDLISVADDETASAWFVELTTAPTSDGTSAAAVEASKNAFRNATRAKGVSYSERYAYGDLWNGFSVSATTASISQIQRIAGVKAIWPVALMTLPEPSSVTDETIDLATAIQMTGADYVQNVLGFTGADIKVAVIDTGVDYDNPDLGGCFGDLCRVMRGWDFVGDAYNADSTSLLYSPTPVPDADPDDCNGHGTHVSGIVGANGVVKGVAPDVRFGAYRVFGCNGSTEADIMLAAMERALKDHMDIINMSIGSAFQWPQYPTAVAADRLVTKHGIVVVASIGNSGANGLYSAGAPGLGDKVIGVASFDNTAVTLPYFTVTPDATKVGYISATGAAPTPTSGSAPMARTGTATTTTDACSAPVGTPPAPGSLTGKVALIRRGTCTFNEKAHNAEVAGAIGVVLYNNFPPNIGFVSATVVGAFPIGIPVVGTSDTLGGLLDARIAAGDVSLTWTADVASFASLTGNRISSFSSYGLSPDLSLKPDIGARGGNIYSTLPREQGGHGSLCGTAMSSAHVAGAVALLLQASPKNLRELAPDRVRAILQNTASPRQRTANAADGLDNVHRQGAGMLNIRAAVESKALVTPSKLALGESQAAPFVRTLTVQSMPGAAKSVTYTLSHEPAASTGPSTFTPTFNTTGAATVTFGAPAVTVKTNQSASLNVTITANATLAERSLYGGYIVLTGDDGSMLRVPYAGFKGDYQWIQVLTPVFAPAPGTPGISARQLGYASNQGAIASQYSTNLLGYAFTMASKPNLPANCTGCGFGPTTFLDVPYYLLHLNHQSQSATFTVYDSTGTTAVGLAFSDEFLPRNSTSTGFFAFAWDGFAGPEGAQTMLPNGEYVMKLTLVKALGDAANPAHVETFTFGKVNIQRAP
jgi:minor extracellular serine protease Vpr